MKTTEEIYQSLLAAFAQRAGFTPEADCDLAVRLYAAAAELQALEFVLVELGLYLDTHSGDAEAFELYKQYAALEKEAREKYEAANGPLFQRSTANSKTWNAWLSDPWPWNYQEGAER